MKYTIKTIRPTKKDKKKFFAILLDSNGKEIKLMANVWFADMVSDGCIVEFVEDLIVKDGWASFQHGIEFKYPPYKVNRAIESRTFEVGYVPYIRYQNTENEMYLIFATIIGSTQVVPIKINTKLLESKCLRSDFEGGNFELECLGHNTGYRFDVDVVESIRFKNEVTKEIFVPLSQLDYSRNVIIYIHPTERYKLVSQTPDALFGSMDFSMLEHVKKFLDNKNDVVRVDVVFRTSIENASNTGFAPKTVFTTKSSTWHWEELNCDILEKIRKWVVDWQIDTIYKQRLKELKTLNKFFSLIEIQKELEDNNIVTTPDDIIERFWKKSYDKEYFNFLNTKSSEIFVNANYFGFVIGDKLVIENPKNSAASYVFKMKTPDESAKILGKFLITRKDDLRVNEPLQQSIGYVGFAIHSKVSSWKERIEQHLSDQEEENTDEYKTDAYDNYDSPSC